MSIKTLTLPLLLVTLPAWSHVGTESVERHLLEHLLIALAIGLPVGYGVMRLLSDSIKRDRQ